MKIERFGLIFALAAGLSVAGAVYAQDTTPAVPEAAAEAEAPAEQAPADDAAADDAPVDDAAADNAPADDAGTGTEDTVEAPTGDPAASEVVEMVRDTFGAWEVRCTPDQRNCFMYQLASDAQNNPVAEVSLLKLPENGDAVAGVTMVTPLGTQLTTGIALQIDNGEGRQYPFNWCSQVGCFARFGLTQQTINAMKRGKSSTITLASVAAPETPLKLNLSLTGFTAAFDSLEGPAK
jgi:invasion protein IalB